MSDDVNFVMDPATGRYVSRRAEAVPEVAVVAWHDDGSAVQSALAPTETALPGRLVLIDAATTAVPDPANDTVASCVLVVSRAALRHPTFAPVVAACLRAVVRRPEFRVFVHFADLTFAEFRALADVPTVADLLDSVQFNGPDAGQSLAVLRDGVAAHLRALPELLNRLAYRRLLDGLYRVVPWLSAAYYLAIFAAVGYLAHLGEAAPASPWFPWLLYGLGAVWYFSILALLSLPAPTTAGPMLRLVLGVAPFALCWLWPASALLANAPYLLAGFFTSAVLDPLRRRVVAASRKAVRPDPDEWTHLQETLSVPGRRTFAFLANGPVLPAKARVFLSYARSSAWGRGVAERLHRALEAAGVPHFFDVADIPSGCSWRHRLQEELGGATVLVQIQDAVTATRPWVTTELAVSASGQVGCGVPTVVMIRPPDLAEADLPAETPALVREALFPTHPEELPLLHDLPYSDDLPERLAHELGRYPGAATAVLPLKLAAVLGIAYAPVRLLLGLVGVFGFLGVWAVVAVFWLLWMRGVEPLPWLAANGLDIGVFVLLAYWLGFTVRLGLASRFEVRHRLAEMNASFQFFTAVVLAGLVAIWATTAGPLGVVGAAVACGVGVWAATDYIDVALAEGNLFRRPPDV